MDRGSLSPTLDWNLKTWDSGYAWAADGDEWTEAAQACDVPYEKWKDSLARTFLIPYLGKEKTALEIGPGHGRWSVIIAPRVGKLMLADIGRSLIEHCRKRLGDDPPDPADQARVRGTKNKHVEYHVTGGRDLPFCASSSVDFIWSYDTFVHIEELETRAYAREFSRVLKRHAMGVIHHPGSPTPEQRQGGMRSLVTAGLFRQILEENGLHAIRQTDSWGEKCNVKFSGDTITIFVKI
jgi:ubiquinone/menaquinone biosynthesis C-methylase UbiE